MNAQTVRPKQGRWIQGDQPLKTGNEVLHQALLTLYDPVYIVEDAAGPALGAGGKVFLGQLSSGETQGLPLLAYAPPLLPQDLGDPDFKERYGLQYAYVAGAMANGITSSEMVEAVAKAGMIGFFGSAGLSLEAIADAVLRLQNSLGSRPFGMNLIHSPNEPDLEWGTVDLYIKHRVRLVSASAYLGLTPQLVYYRIKGIRRDTAGKVVCPNHVFAKVSRVEVAEKFFSPAPEKILNALVQQGKLSREEAELAAFVPMAECLTAEADSGGHTDNRPALTLLPTMNALRDRITAKFSYTQSVPVGLGGGVSTPESAAAAFSMGAAYILTGSVNQACVEAGTSEAVRSMLAEARQADVTMAPAADMFEMGVKVQVLKRGTMFALRAAKLYTLYSQYERYEDIPQQQRALLEKEYLRSSFSEAWQQTRAFFEVRDPRQIRRAESDPRHKMALVFRSYLGRSSGWAVAGDPSRQLDYQIWCGPAMGAFNEWTRGTFLEKPEKRKTVTVAMNLLYGAAVVIRANWITQQGVSLPPGVGRMSPQPVSEIKQRIYRV